MKKLLTMLAAAAISCFCLTAKAGYTGEGSYRIGDYVWLYDVNTPGNWNQNPETGEWEFTPDPDAESSAVITGVKYDSDEVEEPFLEIPEFVVHDGEELTVKAIEDEAFIGRGSIVGVFIPATLESIGCNAFAGCSSLETLEFEEPVVLEGDEEDEYDSSFASKLEIGEGAFADCDALEYVEFPAHIVEIWEGAFRGCDDLEDVTFNSGDGVISIDFWIENSAFEDCTSLQSVEFADWEEYEEYDEETEETITESWACIYIGDSAFKNCHALDDLYLGVGVRSIGESAFERDVSLESVEFPKTLENIGKYAFCDCASLEEVDMTECEGSLEYEENSFEGTPWGGNMVGIVRFIIEDGVLLGCKGILPTPFEPVDLVIPDEVYGIGYGAFRGCDGLRSVSVPTTVEYIEEEAFMGCPDLTSVFIAGEKSNIGLAINPRAFAECENLESVVFEGRTLDGATYDISEEAFYNCQNLATIQFGEGLVNIGERAFQFCISLEEVSFPLSLESIGSLGFGDCISLEEVSYAEPQENEPYIAEDAFLGTPYDDSIGVRPVIDEDGCVVGVDGIVPGSDEEYEIEIPDGVVGINNEAFMNLEGLVAVTIPASVSYIGEYAFAGCTGLEEVEFEEAEPVDNGDEDYCFETSLEIGYGAFAGCTALTSVYFPPQTTCVGESAFEGCSSLEDVYFAADEQVTGGELEIDEYAFNSCKSLQTVTFEDHPYVSEDEETGEECDPWCYFTVTIDEYAFLDCPALTDLYLGVGVRYINDYAFANNTALESVEFPWTVEYIGSYAFGDCESLVEVMFEGDEEDIEIAEDAFEGSPYGGRTRLVIEDNWVVGIKGDILDTEDPFDIEIPDGIEGIGDEAFYGIENLASVTIPASVRYIGETAFASCTGLEYVEFEDAEPVDEGDGNYYYEPALEIGSCAFQDCTALTSVYFPPQTTFVGSYAFYNCSSLEDVCFESDDLVASGELYIDEYAFNKCESLASVSFEDRPYMSEYDEESGEDCNIWCDFAIVIGECAFLDCPALTDLYLGVGVREIGDNAFENNTALEFVEFPWTVEYIGSYAFGNCEALDDVSFEGDEENIEIADDAFEGTQYSLCPYRLEIDDYGVLWSCEIKPWADDVHVEIPDDVVSIAESAFCGINEISGVSIPLSVDYIGKEAFAHCGYLKDVNFEGDMADVCIDAGAFWDTSFNDSQDFTITVYDGVVTGFLGPDVPEEVVIPDGVTEIGESAFDYDYYSYDEVRNENNEIVEYSPVEGIKSIYIPESVKQIGKYAFFDCRNATSVEIANPYVQVEGWAFNKCSSLDELTLVNPGMAIVSMTLTGYAECDDEPWDPESDYADEYFHLEPDESVTVDPDFSLLFKGPEGKMFNNIWVTFNWGIIAKAGFDPTGSGETTEVELVLGEPYGEALSRFEPQVTRHGQKFIGWLVNGKPLTPDTIVGENDVITPLWSELDQNPLYPEEKEEADTAVASIYDGYVLDENGACVGSVQVKVGKENAKTHIAAVSATAQLLGKKKITGFKAKDGGKVNFTDSSLTTTITLVKAGQADIVLTIGKESLNGEWGTYSIAGCRNTSKKNAADYAPWVGVYNVGFETASATGDGAAFANGCSFVSVSVAAKGKVKVSGVMADGVKVTGAGQLLVGEGGNEACACIFAPMYSGKTGGLSFVLWISKDGNVSAESVSDWKSTGKTPFTAKLKTVSVSKLATPAASLKFHLDATSLPAKIGGLDVLRDYLPLNVAAPFAGSKFAVAKANKLKVNRADGKVEVTGGTDNDAGLKLTYTAKSGAFKGSFTIYTLSGGKLKKVKATVNGGIVGNLGYGSAVVKGVGAFPVTLSLE